MASVFTVEKILQKRTRMRKSRGKMRSVVEYLVKWEGYSDTDNTWEPAAHIIDKALIDDFDDGAQEACEVSEAAHVQDSRTTDATAPISTAPLSLPRLPRFTRSGQPHDLFSNFLLAVIGTRDGEVCHEALATIAGSDVLLKRNASDTDMRTALQTVFSEWRGETEMPCELMDELATRASPGAILRTDDFWDAPPQWTNHHRAGMGLVSLDAARNLERHKVYGPFFLSAMLLVSADYGHYWALVRSGESEWIEADVAKRGATTRLDDDAAARTLQAAAAVWVIYVRS